MKSSDEMINSLYERRDNYLTERKNRNKTIMKTATALSCVCLVVLLGVGVFTFVVQSGRYFKYACGN